MGKIALDEKKILPQRRSGRDASFVHSEAKEKLMEKKTNRKEGRIQIEEVTGRDGREKRWMQSDGWKRY